jgi:hypothetical protein
MPNLVQRLRDFRVWNNKQQHYESVPLCNEAALEILSLREQIEAMRDVLTSISNKCPVTGDMTLAHEMAQEAESAVSISSGIRKSEV